MNVSFMTKDNIVLVNIMKFRLKLKKDIEYKT